MANSATGNPLFIDTVGTIFGANVTFNISGFLVTPSNATWAVILKDTTGRVIFSANNTSPNLGAWSTPFSVVGLVADTLTNITSVLIYTTP